MNLNTALLLIDVQSKMFAPFKPVHASEDLLENLQKLLRLTRASGTPVIFVQNNGQAGDLDETRTEGWMLHPEMEIQGGDLIVQKALHDPFTGTELHNVLQKKGIKKLIIAGMQSETCIAATCRKAHELGYGVTLVSDSHSTYATGGNTAEEIIQGINAEMKELVSLWRVSDVEF
ncbi:cysteine hydrolase family protein [Bdellovibrio sp. GT3]|uniref:cysteine hydrolase family protein n=1 Tax=Bdellovibrio sp. GT3 TaxID=3136282 RepID=UPI0030F358ED